MTESAPLGVPQPKSYGRLVDAYGSGALKAMFDSGEIETWREAQACLDADAELFVPTEDERAARRNMREATALAICARCPVRTLCTVSAIETKYRIDIAKKTPHFKAPTGVYGIPSAEMKRHYNAFVAEMNARQQQSEQPAAETENAA